jgi:hypothetical protein
MPKTAERGFGHVHFFVRKHLTFSTIVLLISDPSYKPTATSRPVSQSFSGYMPQHDNGLSDADVMTIAGLERRVKYFSVSLLVIAHCHRQHACVSGFPAHGDRSGMARVGC